MHYNASIAGIYKPTNLIQQGFTLPQVKQIRDLYPLTPNHVA